MSWHLRTNHYHLEVETPDGDISRPLQWLNHRYASYVNRTHDRVGHLFQGRFKSAAIEENRHLHELTRYIHLNPVRAGLVRHPRDYAWSSYRAHIGLRKPPPWLMLDQTLRRFGATRREQRSAYRAFVEAPAEVVQDPLRELQYGAILGTRNFVDFVRGTLEQQQDSPEIAQLQKARLRPSLEGICTAVTEAFEVPSETLFTRGRRHNDARDVALYLARQHSGCRLTEIAEHFGGMTGAAVSIACRRVEARMGASRELRTQVEDVSTRLDRPGC